MYSGAVDKDVAASVLANIDGLIADTNDRWTTIRGGGFSDRHLWPSMPWMFDFCANSGLPKSSAVSCAAAKRDCSSTTFSCGMPAPRKTRPAIRFVRTGPSTAARLLPSGSPCRLAFKILFPGNLAGARTHGARFCGRWR